MSVSTVKQLHPLVVTAMTDALFGGRGQPKMTDELHAAVAELSAAKDPLVRRQSLVFRLWAVENGYPQRAPDETFESLSGEATEVSPAGRLDPIAEVLIARIVGDGWLRRAQFRRAAAMLGESIFWAGKVDAPALESSLVTSLGTALTLAGYLSEGLGVITRTAARAIDCSTHKFIGAGGQLDEERRQVIELADADEHSRNFRRALVGLQLATSLMGPVERTERAAIYLAMARCLCRVDRPETAAEMFSQAHLDRSLSTPFLHMKRSRTETVMLDAAGDPGSALAVCSRALTPALRDETLGLYMELLVDGMEVARRADEPSWVLDYADAVELGGPDCVGLWWTFAHEDLAWASRRVGNRRGATKYQHLARTGRQRFTARSGFSPYPMGAAPGVLRSARERHQRAVRSRDKERVSLAQGIGSVTHDVRNQVQSLELLTGFEDWAHRGTRTVRSIVTAVDDILGGLLHDVEADREIELTEVCLTTVTQDVAERFRSSAEHKQIRLVCNFDRPISCRSDRVALDRIVSNLVSNAIKYSPVGGSVEITTTTLGDAFVDLHVIDSGPGIPSAEIDDLFRWGGKLSSEPTGGETQQGIGLFTAQRLAHLTGASIRPHPRRHGFPSTMSVRLARR